jgi:hypothetical protein
MDLIDNLVRFFEKPKEETKGRNPEGTCPLCWGYQEYDHQIRQLFKDKQIDVNNRRDSYMKVQQFVVKHIDGIRLKQGEIKECPTCGHKAGSQEDLLTVQSEKPINMEAKKPIKRNKDLQPLSRDHHHSLLLSWKIRTGFSKNIAVERIKRYTDWFFEHHIRTHFELEEKYLFPILGNSNELVKKAVEEHRRLAGLFNDIDDISKSLSLIESELEKHIRFEERILFNEIQKVATEEQLEIISKTHSDEKFRDNTDDEFWT